MRLNCASDFAACAVTLEAIRYGVCAHLGDQGMMSDGVESFCEVQGNEVDIVIVLAKTCDLVQKINEGRCSGASRPKSKLVTE